MTRIDPEKLLKALESAPVSKRRFYGMFGGKRRVAGWSKKCNPRFMGGVAKVLGVAIESLLETSKSVGNGVTVEVKVEAPVVKEVAEIAEKIVEEVVEPKKKSKSALKKMKVEDLIVYAHELKPDIDLPDGASKKNLIDIIEKL